MTNVPTEAAPGKGLNEFASVLDRLRSMILTGEIEPGAVVSQVQLARRLGTSTTPLREAMRQLQAEGLLEAQGRNQRMRVPGLDVEDLHAVYASRVLLESLAIGLTVRSLSPEAMARIEELLAGMEELRELKQLDAWERAHRAFHLELISASPPALMPTILAFFERAERYRHLSTMRNDPRGWSDAAIEHVQIVEACRAGDEIAAARRLASHLARTAINLSAAFAPEVEPVSVRAALLLVAGPE